MEERNNETFRGIIMIGLNDKTRLALTENWHDGFGRLERLLKPLNRHTLSLVDKDLLMMPVMCLQHNFHCWSIRI